jgi:hypothetical protein
MLQGHWWDNYVHEYVLILRICKEDVCQSSVLTKLLTMAEIGLIQVNWLPTLVNFGVVI